MDNKQGWPVNEGNIEKLRQQLQQREAQHEEELKKLNAEHKAHVAAVQAQAVAKMKELIEKVNSSCTMHACLVYIDTRQVLQ